MPTKAERDAYRKTKAVVKFEAPHVPNSWPKWPVMCRKTTRNGTPCKARAAKGCRFCVAHGAQGSIAVEGFKKYLFWVLSGHKSSVPEYALKVTAQTLAQAMLSPDDRLESHLTVEDKVVAARYMMELEKTLYPVLTAQAVLTYGLDGDTVLAEKLVNLLAGAGMLRTTDRVKSSTENRIALSKLAWGDGDIEEDVDFDQLD